MNRYYARVELHGGTDYTALHAVMEEIRWFRVITTDDGREMELPSGMYTSRADPAAWSMTDLRDEISRVVAAAALSPTKPAWVLVIESTGKFSIYSKIHTDT